MCIYRILVIAAVVTLMSPQYSLSESKPLASSLEEAVAIQKRIDAAVRKHGLTKRVGPENANWRAQTPAEVATMVFTYLNAAQPANSVALPTHPTRVTASAIEVLSGNKITDASRRGRLRAVFHSREAAIEELESNRCKIATDSTYSDEEFLSSLTISNVQQINYEKLVALKHELSEQELKAIEALEESALHSLKPDKPDNTAYQLEIADLIRDGVAASCTADKNSPIPTTNAVRSKVLQGEVQ